MPTYEYECEKCGNKFDLFQSMKDAPICECPKCKGSVVRLMGMGSGIIFKGSGFYETDYKKKKGSSDKKDSGPSCPSPDSCKNCSLNKEKK
jgi:putative FmdB family regulatory protein